MVSPVVAVPFFVAAGVLVLSGVAKLRAPASTSRVLRAAGLPGGGVGAWSSDGSKIAFTSNRTGSSDVWVMNKDGSNQHAVAANPNADGYPAWNGAGTKLAFQTNRAGTYDVYVVDADGANLRQRPRNPAFDGDPNWAPAGSGLFQVTTSTSVDELADWQPIPPG